MEEMLKETWTKREEQSRLQREARNRLMDEVMEARRLQIQHRRKEAVTHLEPNVSATH